MQDIQINTFTGGLDSDSDLRSVPDSRYIDAINVDTYSIESNSKKSVSPLRGTTLAVTIPSVSSSNQITRVEVDFTSNNTYSFSFYDGTSLKTGSFTTIGLTSFFRYASFRSLLTSRLNNLGYNVRSFSNNSSYVKFTIGKGVSDNAPFRADISWRINDISKETVVLQEAYYRTENLSMIASYAIEDCLFIWSETSDEGVIELGVTKKTGSWDIYTTLFRTWRWHFPIINPEAIDIKMESVSNEQWAMYITDNYNKPKVYYIQKQYSEYCLLKYTNTNWITPTSGYLIYNYADEQTNLQLINNAGVVTFSNQLQAGGSLLSGGYRYSVRFGINGTENTTEWSVLSPNVIPVFKTSINSPSAYIKVQGDKAGQVTSKCNVLFVQNCMPNVFNYVELAAVYHAGAATSATIIGKYPITASNLTITHTGNEMGVQKYDVTLLPQTEPVVKTAKTLEIKKNRFNIANVSIGADDPALASIASGASIGQSKVSMNQVGKIGSGGNLNVSASLSSNLSVTFPGIVSVFDPSIPDLIFNVENKDKNNEYNTSTGVFTSSSQSQIKISFGISYVSTVNGTLLFILYKNNAYYATSSSINITAGSRKIPFDIMNAFGNTVMNFNGTPLNIGDTIKFKIYWQPDSVDPADKLILSSGGDTYLNMGSYTEDSGFELSTVGEYQLPENCANKVGYMLNERYLFFARFHYKNGYVSSPYYIGDYTFSDESNGQLYNDYLQTYTYSYAAAISNINISSIKDKISGISIWRAECNPTVMGSGVYFNSDNFALDYFVAGHYASIPEANNKYYADHSLTDNTRKFGIFFSHDTRLNQTGYIDGSYLRVYGSPLVYNNTSGITNGSKIASFAEYLGVQTTSYESSNNNIIDAYYNDFATLGYVKLVNSLSLAYKPNMDYTNGATGNIEGIAMTLTNYVNSNHGSDNGVYMAQYVRPLSGQYEVASVSIVPTGSYISIDNNSPNVISFTNVFGGDTYTQKNILKVRYWADNGDGSIRSSFITYYAQNKINTQLFYCDQSEDVAPTRNLQGWKDVNSYLFPFNTVDEVAEEQFNYDEGYSAPYPLPVRAYDSNVPSESKFVSRIYYSEQKPINSVQDFYRKIRALDFRDLDTKNGEIVALRDVNNYMVSVQPRAVSVLPYLSDVAIGTQGGGEILVGTGGVYNQRENIISTYGSTFQTCVYVGQNNNGNSQLYWFSPAFKKYCRYGSDGIRILSDEQSMRTYFLGIDSVSKEYDMIQVYDPKYATQIMTFKNESDKYTLLFNENANNFSTFASFKPSRYFLLNNQSLAPYQNSVYELFTGNYLSFFGSLGEFNIKFTANKGMLNDKRYLSTSLSVGTGYTFTAPTVSMSVSSHTAFPHLGVLGEKRWDNFFVAFAKSGGQQPIGQFAIIEVKTSAYIELLGAVTKWRSIFRGLFR